MISKRNSIESDRSDNRFVIKAIYCVRGEGLPGFLPSAFLLLPIGQTVPGLFHLFPERAGA